MNYARVYETLCSRACTRTLTGYSERHHVVPKSLGGLDEFSNIVHLTAREHFIAHWLLVKMQKPETIEYYKMVLAFRMMTISSISHQRVTSRVFERYKEAHSRAMSFMQSGKKNSQYGTRWVRDSAGNSRRIPRDWSLPPHWSEGRTSRVDIDSRKEYKRQERLRRLSDEASKAELKAQRRQQKAEADVDWVDKFLASGLSTREFVKQTEYPYSHMTLWNTVSRVRAGGRVVDGGGL